MQGTLLCIEGKYSKTPTFADALREKRYRVVLARTGRGALDMIGQNQTDVVVLNAPSMRTTGIRICRSLGDHRTDLPVILICKEKVALSVDDVVANVVLTLPFTIRKLENRIQQLLPKNWDGCIKVGDLHLDVDKHMVKSKWGKARLTPMSVQLLAVLMQHAGEIIKRDELFRQVWDTNFTGDTRTLDVHITWLRKAIEKNPQEPKYIKTIRGVGYLLQI